MAGSRIGFPAVPRDVGSWFLETCACSLFAFCLLFVCFLVAFCLLVVALCMFFVYFLHVFCSSLVVFCLLFVCFMFALFLLFDLVLDTCFLSALCLLLVACCMQLTCLLVLFVSIFSQIRLCLRGPYLYSAKESVSDWKLALEIYGSPRFLGSSGPREIARD